MPYVVDAHAPEQAQGREPLLTLDARRVAERLPWTQQQRPFDGLDASSAISHDDDVIDNCLGPFADREGDVRAGLIIGQFGTRLDQHGVVPQV